MTPPQGRYAEVDGLSIYYERHGQGSPLVLLHGGLQTIDTAFGDVLPALAQTHEAMAIELQGHGHTADRDGPLSLEQLADDVAHVLTDARVDQADIIGFSIGGLAAIEPPADTPTGSAASSWRRSTPARTAPTRTSAPLTPDPVSAGCRPKPTSGAGSRHTGPSPPPPTTSPTSRSS
jgi:pimeloyl-ACP methyl ester carboxylesterase